MKVLEITKKIITTVLGIAFFAFALTFTILLLYRNKYGITQFENTSLVIIGNEITSENYQKGDLVVVEGQSIDKFVEGDEIFVYQLKAGGAVNIDLGVVGSIDIPAKEISFENGETYSTEFVIGKTSKIYNDLGTYLSIITSKWGFLFMVLVPSFLIFIFQVYALNIEIKYGEEEMVTY